MPEQENNTVSIKEAAALLGEGVTPEQVRGRIRRGTLAADQVDGQWRISLTDVQELLDEREPCGSCQQPATVYLIIKYHHHERVEFTLCENCADTTEQSYSRKGGVLEVVSYPLLGEGWLKP